MPATKEIYPPAGAGPALPISLATRWGDLLFLSGLAAIDMRTMEVIEGDIEQQASAVMATAAELLRANGSEFQHVLKVNCFLRDADDFAGWNRVFAAAFPSAPPARTTLIAGFIEPGMLIEVEMIAGVP